MAGFAGLGGAVDIVVYKDGEAYTRENFSAFFNSVSKVSAKVAIENMAEVTIELTPSFDDALTILAAGIIGASVSEAGQGVNTGDKSKKSVKPTSFSVPSVSVDSDKVESGQGNMPYYAVKFYYPNEEDSDSDWYGGFASLPQLQMNSGEITITIHIAGTHALSQVIQGPKIYKNEPALDVITKLAATINCDVVFPDGDTTTRATLANAKVLGQYNENNENIIRRILDRLRLRYVKDSGGNPPKARYVITSSQTSQDRDIQYTFVALRQIDPATNQIPCHSFELSSPGLLLSPGHTFGTYSRALISSTKQSKTNIGNSDSYTATSTSSSNSESGAQIIANSDGNEKGGSTGKVDSSDPKEAGAHVTAVGNKELDTTDFLNARSDKSRNEILQFRVEVSGIPRPQPLDMAQVLIGPGAGGIEGISGPMQIHSVEHIYDSSGWNTSLELWKNGGLVSKDIPSKGTEVPKVKDAKVNKKPQAIK